MANPLFNILGNAMQNSPIGNAMNMMQQFNQFRQQFRGDPRQQVQELLNSGRITQDDYNRAVSMANEFRKLMNTR